MRKIKGANKRVELQNIRRHQAIRKGTEINSDFEKNVLHEYFVSKANNESNEGNRFNNIDHADTSTNRNRT
jgi:hypothetical protein